MTRTGTRKLIAALLALACLAPGAGVAGMMGGGMMGDGGMMGNGGMMNGASVRHRYVMRHGLPAQYAHLRNPLDTSADNVGAGKRLYEHNCSTCHGITGKGDGPAGRTLQPPAADLARTLRLPMASDAYLYWAIAEGGAQFGTAMPAMKGTWQPNDIWKTIVYMRTF